MKHCLPILSFCITCRDGNEALHRDIRGGTRLAHAFLLRSENVRSPGFTLRGVRCMSQCKRACIVSLCANGCYSYIFGDLDASDPDHVAALDALIALYAAAPEGFLQREARPEPLRARILGRLPPPGSTSDPVTSLDRENPVLERPCHA